MKNLIDEIKSLDTSDVGKWPGAFRAGAIGLIFLIAAVLLVYLLAWKPNKPELDAARAEETTLLTTLEQKARKAANLDAYRAQLQEIEQSFGATLRKLPDKSQVDSLLTDVSQQGSGAGLEQKLFQPAAQVTKDFYAELPIRMRWTGSFHAIGNFVSGIAALPRIVTLHDIQIAPLGKTAGADELQLDVTAKTYRYLDDEEQAAMQPKPDPRAKRKKRK